MARPVFIIDGSRTPFLKARSGPGPFTPVDLAVQCGRPLLARQPSAPSALDQADLGCVYVNARGDDPGPGCRVAARHGGSDGGIHGADQLRLRHAIDRHGLSLYPRRHLRLDFGRRLGSAELRAFGLAAAGRALVRRAGRRQGNSRQDRGDRESAPGLLQADHRPGARADRSDHRTQHGTNRRSGRSPLRHHPRAIGRLCRRKPQAVGQRAGAGISQGRGRNRVRARRQILRSRRWRAAGFLAGDAGETKTGIRTALGPGHRRQLLANHRRRIMDYPRFGRRRCKTRPDAEGRDRRQPMVGARSQHHGPWPGAVGDRTLEAQQIVARGYRDLGIERGICHPGTRMPRRLEGRKVLPRDPCPRRCCRANRPREAQCRWRRDQPRPSRWLQRQPYRAASRQCDEAIGHPTRHRHRMHRWRAGRRHVDRDGVGNVMDSRIMDVLGDRVLELGPKPDENSPYRNFKLTRDSDGIAWLLFDRADASANTLSAEIIEELDTVLAALENQRPAGLVIRSAKKSGFIAGADVKEFRGATDARLVETGIGRAHAVIDRLEGLKISRVAVIHGFCLGGGLEVALACQSRIAIDGARFGFPEVMLGLHPGLGGTARFTALVNPMQAMTLMLTGKTIDARKAKSLGLVDAVTQERHVRNAVKDAVFGRLKHARPGLLNTILNSGPVRGFLASRMRSEAEKAAPHEHYPAPYALIDLWEKHGGDRAAMLAAEKASFANSLVSQTAQNLIRVFLVREQMKKLAGDGNRIRQVHVIGAGAMGGDIAAWCANQGLRVTLGDMKPEPIAGAIKRAADLFGKIMRKGTDIREALDRLMPDLDGEGVRNADLIIEAVPEQLELKQKVYAGLERRMKPGAILATH